MTGAGISVSAGIPDFRTPGTGLYSQLKKFNLPYPEAIFEIDYFQRNPRHFYTLAKQFLSENVKPTISHYFQTEFQNRNMLMQIFTQNIDGLEIEAGIDIEKLVQAHGHYRTAHCIRCKGKADIEEFKKKLFQDEIYFCQNKNCKGLIKPDIVFFGELLPQNFQNKQQKLEKCDLVLIMGTSLVVYPFAYLIDNIPQEVPIILINRENPGIQRENCVFLQGDIDQIVFNLMQDLKWDAKKYQSLTNK